jgi:hypothetical protein
VTIRGKETISARGVELPGDCRYGGVNLSMFVLNGERQPVSIVGMHFVDLST